MRASWRFLVVVVFLAGFVISGLLGTSTSMTFIWPGYALLGLAGVLSIAALFRNVGFSLPRWTTLASFALVGYLLIRAGESDVSYFAREDAALVVACFLSYALFLSLFSTSQWRMAVMASLAGLVVINVVYAAIQGSFNPSLWLLPGYERTYTDRVGGLFNHPDHFAGFVASMTPLWVCLAVFGRSSRRIRIAWAVLAVISASTVILTGSGPAVLAMLVGVAVAGSGMASLVWKRLDVRFRRTVWAGLGGVALILVAVFLIAGGPLLRQIDASILTKDDGASIPAMWEGGFEQMMRSPILGTGSRSSYYYSRLFRSEKLSGEVADPEFVHNEFLQLLADYGAIGFLLLAAVIVLHGANGFRFVRAYAGFGSPKGLSLPRSDHLGMVLGALAVLAAMGTLSVFDFPMHLPVFALTASLLAGILAAPDPMASALQKPEDTLIPGGSLMLANRAGAFACGLALTFFGVIYARSEYHFEMARLAFEGDSRNFQHFPHLKSAREYDPKNPYAFILSAHAQVAGITSEMARPARIQALEQADRYFSKARQLYPQDVHSAVGHAAVLDELGRKSRAQQRLADAMEWAPLYGNLMLAEAEHHLRYGEVSEAEEAYRKALRATAFANNDAAVRGLKTISEWKLIAQSNGIEWQDASPDRRKEGGDSRSLPSAKVEERVVAGEAIPEPEEWAAEENESEPSSEKSE